MKATVTCDHCPWTAEMTGDDILEIARFLRNLVIEHVTEAHPETLETP